MLTTSSQNYYGLNQTITSTALWNGQIGVIRYPTVFITNAPEPRYDTKSNQLLARKIKRSLITAEIFCAVPPGPARPDPDVTVLRLLRGRGQAPRPTR